VPKQQGVQRIPKFSSDFPGLTYIFPLIRHQLNTKTMKISLRCFFLFFLLLIFIDQLHFYCCENPVFIAKLPDIFQKVKFPDFPLISLDIFQKLNCPGFFLIL